MKLSAEELNTVCTCGHDRAYHWDFQDLKCSGKCSKRNCSCLKFKKNEKEPYKIKEDNT